MRFRQPSRREDDLPFECLQGNHTNRGKLTELKHTSLAERTRKSNRILYLDYLIMGLTDFSFRVQHKPLYRSTSMP